MQWKPASELPAKAGRYVCLWWHPGENEWRMDCFEFYPHSEGINIWLHDYGAMTDDEDDLTSCVRYWAEVPLPDGVEIHGVYE